MIARGRRVLARLLCAPLHAKHRLASNGWVITANERRLLALRDCYRGQRCFIIGGGPSLKKMNLQLLRSEVTFVVNGFYHLLGELGFRPTFYVVEDRLVAEDNAREINALKGMTKIFPEDLRYKLRASDETIFVQLNRYYVNPDRPGPDFPRFAAPGCLEFYWGGTVSYLNLQLAYYMGFTEVYVIGMDMDYTVPSGVTSNVIMSQAKDVNHAHPDWFGPGKRWHRPRVDQIVQAFQRAREVFESDGRRLFNATAGGKLEVLERVSFERVLEGNAARNSTG